LPGQVQDLHRAVSADLDIRGFEIAMDDALRVGRFKGFGNLLGDRQRLIEKKGPARDALGEGYSFDQLQDQCDQAGGFFKPIDGGNVRVVQRSQNFGFSLEAAEALGIAGDGRRQNLNGDRALQVSVAQYTSPMPPTPIWLVTSYGPRRVPGARDMGESDRRDYRRMWQIGG
jgi:hypothetical protein